MKKLLISIVFSVTVFLAYPQGISTGAGFGLPIDSSTQKITFQEVVRVGGSTKDELFERAHNWFTKNFGTPESVIEMDNKATGKIIAKGTYHGSYHIFLKPNPYTLYFTMGITVKEGRYRYEVGEFSAEDDISEYTKKTKRFALDAVALNPKNKNSKGEYKGDQRNYLEAASIQGLALSKSLKAAMYQVPATGVKSKDDF